ncbi:hypothetical protein AB6A40_010138 [Gnathostoma spinigerum]|uniref:Uncharacterized protein n=1 Tax=Gnathostoma spinigerum TaxID=75299 RepID=A0ABD6ETY0_9BILA
MIERYLNGEVDLSSLSRRVDELTTRGGVRRKRRGSRRDTDAGGDEESQNNAGTLSHLISVTESDNDSDSDSDGEGHSSRPTRSQGSIVENSGNGDDDRRPKRYIRMVGSFDEDDELFNFSNDENDDGDEDDESLDSVSTPPDDEEESQENMDGNLDEEEEDEAGDSEAVVEFTVRAEEAEDDEEVNVDEEDGYDDEERSERGEGSSAAVEGSRVRDEDEENVEDEERGRDRSDGSDGPIDGTRRNNSRRRIQQQSDDDSGRRRAAGDQLTSNVRSEEVEQISAEMNEANTLRVNHARLGSVGGAVSSTSGHVPDQSHQARENDHSGRQLATTSHQDQSRQTGGGTTSSSAEAMDSQESVVASADQSSSIISASERGGNDGVSRRTSARQNVNDTESPASPPPEYESSRSARTSGVTSGRNNTVPLTWAVRRITSASPRRERHGNGDNNERDQDNENSGATLCDDNETFGENSATNRDGLSSRNRKEDITGDDGAKWTVNKTTQQLAMSFSMIIRLIADLMPMIVDHHEYARSSYSHIPKMLELNDSVVVAIRRLIEERLSVVWKWMEIVMDRTEAQLRFGNAVVASPAGAYLTSMEKKGKKDGDKESK